MFVKCLLEQVHRFFLFFAVSIFKGYYFKARAIRALSWQRRDVNVNGEVTTRISRGRLGATTPQVSSRTPGTND